MKRVMLRLPDDVYHRVNRTAHYRFKSMNAWILDLVDDHAFTDEVIKHREEADQ